MYKISQLTSRRSKAIDPESLLPESILPFPIKITLLLYLLCFVLIWIIPFGTEGPSTAISYLQGVAFASIIAASIALLLRLSIGTCIYAVFVQALFVRLLVLACFYLLAPAPLTFPGFNITMPTLAVWNDDVHYVGAAEYIDRMHTTAKEVVFDEKKLPFPRKVGQIGLLISFFKGFMGNEQVWLRFITCLIGSLTAVFIVLSLRRFFSPSAQKLGAALAIIGPEFIQSSLLLYKEVYVHFASSLFLLALWMIAKDRGIKASSGTVAFFGLLLLWWSRQDAFSLAVIFLILHIAVWMGKISNRFAMRICLIVLLTALTMATFGFGPKSEEIKHVISETSTMQGSSFGWASSFSGPARVVNIPLSFANPPPFLLHEYVLIQPGNYPWFRTVFRELRTLQWWWMVPWIVFGLWGIFKRFGKLATFVMPYMCLWFVAAVTFNGVGPEVVRYRDTFLPCAVFLAVVGYEFAGKKWRSFAAEITVFAVIGIWLFMNFR